MPYTGTIPSGTLAVGAGLPAAWTQQTGLSLAALESAWAAYTPTLGGFTLGNGVLDGRYMQVGKLVVFQARLTFGSTTTAAATLTLTAPPVTSVAAHAWNGNIRALFYDSSATQLYGALATLPGASSTVNITVSGTNGAATAVSTTIPFTWAVSDQVLLMGTYEAA